MSVAPRAGSRQDVQAQSWVAMRRAALLSWVREHDEWSAAEIADVSGIYEGHGKADRCFDDLVALSRKGAVTRGIGRPARWSAY